MNDKKVAFIYCVNNRELYKESVRYIKSLYVPEGYEIEIIAIEGASSITSGYNQGMKQTDAKFKVYLHQDVFIVNKNFLANTISIFLKYPKLGLLGVIGAKSIPSNSIWWESLQPYGKVYESHTGKMKLLNFNETKLDYEPVQAIDGLIMITQFDIPWREDIFSGWHFYDLSQCQEFISLNYEIGVVSQKEPWCVHDCGVVNVENGFDEFKLIFIDEYKENIERLNKFFLPLVSILIPTYNQTDYLRLSIESAINQTYKNIEIIIGDDSTTESVKEFISPYLKKYNNITYFKNKREHMDYGISNLKTLLHRSNGEYVNYLFHDDLFHNTKIEKMVNHFLQDEEISLVTSHRQLINNNGDHLLDDGATLKLFENDTKIFGKELSFYCISKLTNFIGEPTTVLFKKQKLEVDFGCFNNSKYVNIADLGTWFSLLLRGKAVYIPETLSYFRQHSEQNSQKSEIKLMGIEEWRNLIEDSYQVGIIPNRQEYKKILETWLNVCYIDFKQISTLETNPSLINRLKEAFISSIETLTEKNNQIEMGKANKLVILDDVFPNLHTGFRVAEYNYYLENLNAKVYSEDSNYKNNIVKYSDKYPEIKEKVSPINKLVINRNDSLVYTVFLNNAYRYLPIIEKENKKFVFTLYPGGGFWLFQEESDKKLREVCNSKNLLKIIVTQKITYDYLIYKKFIDPQKIEFIYGGVLPSHFYKDSQNKKQYYKRDKETFDICFVANKYMPKGLDKGYDIFIDVSKVLVANRPDINFHVVGGFNKNDIPLDGLEDRIHFHGMQYLDFFPSFYSKMDIILSPNKSFVLYPGSFDGFPTGCCVEAAFNGVAVFCTDDLKNNILFKDAEELCIIDQNIEDIVNKILYYYENLDELYLLSEKGKKKTFEVLDFNEQMSKRVEILNEFL